MAETIAIEEFRRLDLRVGTVRSADVHPKADRLLVLRVDVGGEERQLVAGIRAHYRPEELIGRQVVVVANLAPAALRGVESQGMVLAAADGDQVVIVAPDRQVSPGAPVR
jgi:methionyl-tRNA synthetase